MYANNRSIAIVCKEHLYLNKKKTYPVEKWAENRHRLYPEKKRPLHWIQNLAREKKSFTSDKCYKKKQVQRSHFTCVLVFRVQW